jgi:hypothetical protein
MTICMGLDISTNIIGVSVFDNLKCVYLNYIDLRKIDSLFKKADFVRSQMKEIKDKNFNIECISIEESAQSFRKGFSSAQVLSILSRFNGVVSQISYEEFKVEPIYYNVSSARKSLGIKIDKSSEIDTKEQILNWVKSNESEIEWPVKNIVRGKNKGDVKFEPACYDMADAYVIGKAAVINEYKNDK